MRSDGTFEAIGSHRILAIHGGRGDAQRYRCVHLRQQLGLCRIPCQVREFRGESSEANHDYDLVVFHRIPFDRYIDRLVSQIHERGGLVIFDTDDLIFDSSALGWVRALSNEDALRIELHTRDVGLYRRMLGISDAVLVSTDYLARQTSALGKPSRVHRNAFSLEMLSTSQDARGQQRRRDNRIVIGYASGTPTHNRDFQEARPALQEILGKYPRAELRIIGPLDPGHDWGTLRERIRHVPFVPWRELPHLLAQFDVNIAPLEPGNPFCEAKSEVKYIEAGLVGVPTVASRIGAFEFAIRPGENGFLASTHDEWTEALERLVGDAALRREMGERAYEDVLQRYHPLVRGRELISTLNGIAKGVRGRPLWNEEAIIPLDVRQLQEAGLSASLSGDFDHHEKYPSLIARSLYAIRYRGLRVFLMQGWVFVKRRVMHLFGRRSAG